MRPAQLRRFGQAEAERRKTLFYASMRPAQLRRFGNYTRNEAAGENLLQ